MGKAISGKAIREMRERERKAHRLEKRIKVGTRLTHLNYLIVCEGEQTEPNYFKALVKGRNSQVLTAVVAGEGASTKSLIDIALKQRSSCDIHFDVVWAVFDKDEFRDFNEAIAYAVSNGVNPAWSNESFELWYYLHFQFLDTQNSRQQYIDMLTREIRKVYPEFEYHKNDKGMYELLQRIGNQEQAIKNAKALEAHYEDDDYASHKPCTTVYKLVEELNNPEEVIARLNQQTRP